MIDIRRVVAAACLAGAIGCAGRSTPPAAPPPPPPATPQSLPVRPFAGPAGAEVALVQDRLAGVLAAAESEFEAGRLAWGQSKFEAARDHFDRAVNVLISVPEGARSDPRLSRALTSLVDRISAIELAGIRSGAGVAETKTEPAAIDELLTLAAVDRPTAAATTRETVAADLERTPHDVPIPLHPKVLQYVELFQGRLRDFMQEGLERAQPYLPMITRVFKEEGVPLDLVYLPLVESAFKTNALSRASARGMWQFMPGTGREHDLEQTWFVDERSDPEQATAAAARYLKTLNGMFDGDWHFALASYNAGPGRLQGAVRRSKKTDYWAIISSTRYLPRETREYVPMVLAAIVIARNPELYGFTIDPATPLVYETVRIPDALALETIAEWAEVPVEQLRELNPALRRGVTPAKASYDLKVPVGVAATVQAKVATHTEFLPYRFHIVKRGETLATIARKYGVTPNQLREMNELRSSRVKAQQEIRIPLSTRPASTSASAAASTKSKPAVKPAAGSAPPAGSHGGSGSQVYRVRAGDTLYSIARQFDTTVDLIKRANRLESDRIRIGDRLTIPR
jgi:membrane-bound lytic murein transglycosylase D